MPRKRYDDSDAPTLVYVYNPTPEVIKARHEGYDLLLPPNTRTRWYSEQYLGSNGEPNGQYVPIANWAARAMCQVNKWGREGLVLMEPKTDPTQAAKAGLIMRIQFIESSIRGMLKHHAESKVVQQLLKVRDIRCNDMHHPRYGDAWFIPDEELTRTEREAIEAGQDIKTGIYNDELKAVRECLDNVGSWSRKMITVSDINTDATVRGLQLQIEKLAREKAELIVELDAAKPDGRSKEGRALREAKSIQQSLEKMKDVAPL